MALILISHDLGVVKDRTDNIAVMYGGRLMENADTGEVFARTAHPYTEALQSAIPDMATPRGERLATIAGAPPDLSIKPTGLEDRLFAVSAKGCCLLGTTISGTRVDSSHKPCLLTRSFSPRW